MSKKLVIIGGAGVVVIGLVLFLFGFFNSSKDLKSNSADLSIIPTINQKKPENIQSFYEMEIPVPENWNYTVSSFRNGGVFHMNPKINPQGVNVPSFTITRWGIDRLSDVNIKQNQYANNGFEIRNNTLNESRVLEFYGVDPVKLQYNGKDYEIRQNIIFYTFADSVYLIQYKYQKDEDVSFHERNFNAILESIKFN